MDQPVPAIFFLLFLLLLLLSFHFSKNDLFFYFFIFWGVEVGISSSHTNSINYVGINPQWLSKVRRLWPSVPRQAACELIFLIPQCRHHHRRRRHLSLNREGRWGTTDDFITSFLHFLLFSTALWDLANSRPVHSLMLSSHLFLNLPICLVFFPLSLCLARWFWPDLKNGKHVQTTAVCISLQWSGGLHVVQLPAGSWHGLPRW